METDALAQHPTLPPLSPKASNPKAVWSDFRNQRFDIEMGEVTLIRKSLMSVIFAPYSRAGNGLRQTYGRPAFFALSTGKPPCP